MPIENKATLTATKKGVCVRKLSEKSYNILKEIIQFNPDLKEIALKYGYKSKSDKLLKRSIKKIIDNHSNLIFQEDGVYKPTEEGKKVFYKDTIYVDGKQGIDIHYLGYKTEILSHKVNNDILEHFESIADEYRYEHGRQNDYILNIWDRPLGFRLMFTTKNNLYIWFIEPIQDTAIDKIMSLAKQKLFENIPIIERKYGLKINGLEFKVQLHSRHIAMINHPLGIWCKHNKAKICIKDQDGIKLLTFDESGGYNHTESEHTKRSPKILEAVNELHRDAIDGIMPKKNKEWIDDLFSKITTQNSINVETADFMRKMNNVMGENLKLQSLLVKETLSLKWLKKNVNSPEDLIKYKDTVENLNGYEKKELEDHLFSITDD